MKQLSYYSIFFLFLCFLRCKLSSSPKTPRYNNGSILVSSQSMLLHYADSATRFPEPDPIIELLLKPLYFGLKCLYPLSRDTVTRGQVFYLVTGSSLNDLPLIRNGKNNVT